MNGLLTVLTAGVLFLAMSCASTPSSAIMEPIIVDKVESQVGNIKVVTDPASEVVMLLLRLAGNPDAVYPAYGNSDFNVAVDTWFLKYKKHPSVKIVEKLSQKYSMMNFLMFTGIVNEDMTGLTKSFEELNGWSKNDIQTLLSAVNQFAYDTKFEKFYLLQRASYINMQNGVVDALRDGTVEKYISEVFLAGKPFKETLHVSELLAGKIFWYHLDFEEKGYDDKIFLSPYWSKEAAFSMMTNISLPVIHTYVSTLPEDYLLSFKLELNKMREKNGLEPLNDAQSKDALMGDISYFTNLFFLREIGEEEDFDVTIEKFENAYSEEMISDFVDAFDEYYEKPVESRNYEKDFFEYLAKVDLEMLKILAGR